MSEIVKIGCIKYLNALPLFHDFNGTSFEDSLNRNSSGPKYEITYDTPSGLNEMMKKGELDIASVSSLHYIENREDLQLMNKVCISASGKVMSVFLASKYNLSDLSEKTVYLTDESASSAALAKIMLCEFFGNTRINFKTVKVLCGGVDHELESGTPAAILMIGDEALRYYQKSAETENNVIKIYDLSELWNSLTSLPFIFGVIAAKKDFYFNNKISCEAVAAEIQSRLKYYRENKAAFIEKASERSGIDQVIVGEYYNCLNYEFKPEHIMSLEEFDKRFKKIATLAAVR